MAREFWPDRLLSGDRRNFGYATGHPELTLAAMSEEHGHLDLAPGYSRPRVGEKISIIPSHVCPCVNLHGRVYHHRNGVVEGCWTVGGRGMVQ